MGLYIGQIVWFGFNFAPDQFAQCNGQLLTKSSNPALFALLGTTYGGDGVTTFALPNIQGRVAIGLNNVPGYVPNNAARSTYLLGATGGEEFHALTLAEIPSHTHSLNADAATPGINNGGSPSGTALGISADVAGNAVNSYAAQAGDATLGTGAVGNAGGGQGHENRMPYVVLTACICLYGTFPPTGS